MERRDRCCLARSARSRTRPPGWPDRGTRGATELRPGRVGQLDDEAVLEQPAAVGRALAQGDHEAAGDARAVAARRRDGDGLALTGLPYQARVRVQRAQWEEGERSVACAYTRAESRPPASGTVTGKSAVFEPKSFLHLDITTSAIEHR